MARWAKAWAPTSGKARPVSSRVPPSPRAAATAPYVPALGSPAPSRFYVDGGALVLKGLRAEDSGAYTCVAHNAAGEDARLHTVSVLGEQRRGEEGGGSALPGLRQPGHCVASTRGHLEGGCRGRDAGDLVPAPAMSSL